MTSILWLQLLREQYKQANERQPKSSFEASTPRGWAKHQVKHRGSQKQTKSSSTSHVYD